MREREGWRKKEKRVASVFRRFTPVSPTMPSCRSPPPLPAVTTLAMPEEQTSADPPLHPTSSLSAPQAALPFAHVTSFFPSIDAEIERVRPGTTSHPAGKIAVQSRRAKSQLQDLVQETPETVEAGQGRG